MSNQNDYIENYFVSLPPLYVMIVLCLRNVNMTLYDLKKTGLARNSTR